MRIMLLLMRISNTRYPWIKPQWRLARPNTEWKAPVLWLLSESNCGILGRNLRGASHYGHWIERTLNKLSLREQGRSTLKYANTRVYISLERKVCPLEESLDFHKYYG
jgi:hypothetical protein